MIKRILNKINKRFFKLGVECKSVADSFKVSTDYNDGYCIIPNKLLNPNAVFYSFGAGEDIEMECILLNKFGCDVYIFDPTPRSKQHIDQLLATVSEGGKMRISNNDRFYNIAKNQLEKIHFESKGIWNEDTFVKFYQPKNNTHVSHSITNLQKTANYINVEVGQLKTIMKEKGHDKINFLKMDIEGAEFDVIDNLLATNVKFDALYLEFHLVDESNYLQSMKYIQSYVHKLEAAGYQFLSVVKNKYFSCIHKDWLAKN